MRFFPFDLEGAVTGLAATQSEQLGLARRGDGHASPTAPSGPGGVSARFLVSVAFCLQACPGRHPSSLQQCLS